MVFSMNYFPLTASLNIFPATNFGCTEAGILISLPVAGLRPVLAARSADLKVPKTDQRDFITSLYRFDHLGNKGL